MRRFAWWWMGLMLAGCDGDDPATVDAGNAEDGGGLDAARDLGPELDVGLDGDARPDAMQAVDSTVEIDQAPDATVWPAVVLNEVDCRGRDWIELYGPAGTSLAGWRFTDVEEAGENVRFFQLPADARLDADGFFAVRAAEGDEPGFDFGIGCDEALFLLTPDGGPGDTVTLPGNLPPGATFGRLPDGGGEFVPTIPSRGAPNAPWITAEESLFQPAILLGIQLDLPPESRALLEADPLDPFVEVERATVPAFLTVATPEGDWGPAEVGVRLKGRLGSLRGMDRKAGFKIDINFTDPGQDLFGLRSLALNNAVQDPSFLHELAAYRMLTAAGLPSLGAGHGWVQVDGDPFGVYVVLEAWDDAVRRHFPTTDLLVEGLYGQDLFQGQTQGLDVDAGNAESLEILEEIARILANPPPEGAYEALQDKVDWDQVLGVMALELFVGHWDGYAWTRNNWFMHLDGEGRLSLLPWGLDQIFNDFLPLFEGQGLLLQRCVEDDRCAERHARAVERVMNGLDTIDLPAELAQVAMVLAPFIAQDPRKEVDEGTVVAWQESIPRFIEERRRQVGELLACRLGPNPDPDGDGVLCDRDCAPDDPTIAPGQQDICGDGIDQDCTGFADDAPECPDCVERPARGGGTWLICPRGRTYEQAETLCAEQGATLVKIGDRRTNEALHEIATAVRPVEYWIGLDDLDEEGVFRWADGSLPLFTAWDAGEPNDSGGEDCAHYWADRPLWNDIPCEVQFGAICQRPEP